MTKHTHIMRSIFSLLLLLTVQAAYGQFDIGITVNITPPYSPRIDDYVETPGKLILILKNNTAVAKSIYLQVKITGDNGVSAATDPSSKPAQPVLLQPGQVMQADANTLRQLFSIDKAVYTGFSPAEYFKKNGLPEGLYNVCVRAFDFNTNAPLSSDAPMGCRTIPLGNLEPPMLIKPMADEVVKNFEPQNVIFTWTIPAGTDPGTQYKVKIIEMLDPKKNINDAFNSATTPPFFETTVSTIGMLLYGPAQPKLVPGRKYAWAVTAIPGNNKIAFRNNGRSEVRSFIYHKPQPAIVIIYPADQASFPPMSGIPQNAFYFKWMYTNPNKEAFMEDVYVYELKAGQTPEEAVKNNKRINTTNEPSLTAMFSPTINPDGKSFVWFIQLNNNGTIYKSPIRKFSVESGVSNTKIPSFDLCGFPVKVNNLVDKGGYKYSGSGTTQLYKGGPSIIINFTDLVIQPFGIGMTSATLTEKPQSYVTDFRAVSSGSGAVKVSFLSPKEIKYKLPQDISGDLRFKTEKIEFTPAIKSSYDAVKKIFINPETYGAHGVQVYGRFNWTTEYVYTGGDGTQQVATFLSTNLNRKFDYVKTFDEKDPVHLGIQVTGMPVNTVKLMNATTLKLSPVFYVQGTKVKFKFDGFLEIPGKSSKPGLTVNFSDKESLVFEQAIPLYSTSLNTDNSVAASFDQVKVNMMDVCIVNIPALKINVAYSGSTYPFTFSKAFFNSYNGLYCKEESLAAGDIKLSTFDVALTKSKISIVNSKLQEFIFEGRLQIPFVNQEADLEFSANGASVQEGYVSFEAGKTSTLLQDLSGNAATFTPYSGKLLSDRIIMTGDLNISNTDPEKNLNIKITSVPDFYIKGNGELGMVNSSPNGAPIKYQSAATYNGFKFTGQTLALLRESGKYKIKIAGMLVLADNLASTTAIPGVPNFSATVAYDAVAYNGGGPPPNMEAGISSTPVNGGRHDGTVDFGSDFTYYDNDPVYGKGFMAEGSFGMQQPDPMQVHAKMVIARAPAGFNYWFFEAGQENVIQIPTGVLDLGIYGFTGRVYYKMNHAGANINSDDYVPDNGKFIGIYGLTQLKTLTDNGAKFWGNVAFEVLTNNSGLESIKFRGDGDLMSGGVGTDGMVKAHGCVLEFYWDPKEIYGVFNVDANFQNMITSSASAGFDITPDNFDLWADATGAQLFGNNSFGADKFGFRLTNEDVHLYGNFNLVNIHRGFSFWVCKPSVDITAKLYIDAHLNYSPFQFKGGGELHGNIHVAGCKLSGNIGLHLKSQLMFPSPTCASAGISIETPLKDFGFNAGIKNGGIIFHSCF